MPPSYRAVKVSVCPKAGGGGLLKVEKHSDVSECLCSDSYWHPVSCHSVT